MKVRIGHSLIYLEIENPTQLSEKDNKTIQEMINARDLKCDGCKKPLKNSWIAIIHRPKSAFDKEENKLKEIWAMYLFCYDTRLECIEKWKNKETI